MRYASNYKSRNQELQFLPGYFAVQYTVPAAGVNIVKIISLGFIAEMEVYSPIVWMVLASILV